MAEPTLNRRRFLALFASTGASALLAACGGSAPETPAAQAPTTDAPAAPAATSTPVPTLAPVVAPTAVPEPTKEVATTAEGGVVYPDDAAPIEYQTFVTYIDNTANFTSPDFLETVYNQGGFGSIVNVLGEPLIRLNKNFEVQPAAATSWEANEDATVWTFHLNPELVWSDGTPLTAHDYVHTFRYAADPEHAWDFAWYYSEPGAIVNWDAVVAGEKPLEELGVTAIDDYTLEFKTESPAPFLPAKLLYSQALQKAAFEKHGPLYNTDPATSVSAGPYILKEWTKGSRLVYEANPNYKGNNKPYIQKVICIYAKPETMFTGYQQGEVDFVHSQFLSSADLELINADPELAKQVRLNSGDFRTDYLFFDVTKAPFDDIRVRQAISHVVDRDTIITNILTNGQAIPAYSFLMPGFPASNSDGLKDIQAYDPEKAKALLAEAGYPDGQGFPKLTLWLRNEPQVYQQVAQAIAASIKQNLGIEVEVSNKDYKTFMDALNAKPTQIDFGMVSYGIDFLDPSNMLGVWLSGGRHSWSNEQFDALVREASASLDMEGRIKQFMDAERILVEDVPAIWISHRTRGDLLKPYFAGSELEANIGGFSAIQWPDFSNHSSVIGSMYVTKDVLNYRKEPPK
jgi:ABC-type dipeptide transport system, periplasmic component